MKKLILFFCAATGFAALPPLAQSTREMQAVLSDARFYEALGSGEVIQELIRTEKGYLVLTPHYAMRVDIKYGGDQRRIGPVQFELEFQSPVDLRTGQPKN